MKETASLWNRNFKLYISLFVIVLTFLAIQLHAQDGCSSFGWANLDGQSKKGPVTGGGDAKPITVTSFKDFKSAVESKGAKVIHVKGTIGNGYKGKSGDLVSLKSDKTIIGYPGAVLKSSVRITGVQNVIVKNIIIEGPGSASGQGYDNVTIQGSKRIWFDHCEIFNGGDGNFDVVKGADNVTASWCIFKYTKSGGHDLSNLIGSSNSESQSHGKLNVTYAYCWWENVKSRCPRTRYGKIHVLNCYYNNVNSAIAAGKMSNIRAEGCFFEDNVRGTAGTISTDGNGGVFVIDCNRGSTKADGMKEAFTPPYEYKKYKNSEVKNMVTNSTSGAGATLNGPTDCGDSSVTTNKYFQHIVKAASVPTNATDNINVNLNLKNGDKVDISLINLTGQKITGMKSVSTNSGLTTTTLDLRKVISGLYILKVNTNGQTTTQRIFKTR